MTGLAWGLIFLSAVAHASWNFLVKRGNNQEVFVWWLLVCQVVILLPLAIVLGWLEPIEYPGWWYVLGTCLLHTFYFLFLSRGYAQGDLSVVYPISRGMGPALVPISGVLVLNESVSALAVVGIVVVVLGIYTVYWWGRFPTILRNPFQLLGEPSTRYALITGLTIAIYSIWDTVGVRYVTPFLYMYLLSLGSLIFLSPYIFKTYGAQLIRLEWRQATGGIVASGLLTFVGYGLVLTALTFAKVSYVVPVRSVGIIIGVLLGTLVLIGIAQIKLIPPTM